VEKKLLIFIIIVLPLIFSSCFNGELFKKEDNSIIQQKNNEKIPPNNKVKELLNNINMNNKCNTIFVDGYLVGEFKNSQYITFNQLSQEGDWRRYTRNYDIYSVQEDTKNIFGCKVGKKGYIKLDKIDKSSIKHFVALTCDWEARKRKAKIINEYDNRHLEAVEEILKKSKLLNAPPVIKSIRQIDLDGDGTDEEIIEASNSLTLNNDEQIICDKRIEICDSIKSFECIGYYRIFILMKDQYVEPLLEYYSPIKEVDFTFRTEEELEVDGGENCRPSNTVIYLYSKDNKIKLYRPYETDWPVGSSYSVSDIVDILDINNDNSLEIITKQSEYLNGEISILEFSDNNIKKILVRKFWSS